MTCIRMAVAAVALSAAMGVAATASATKRVPITATYQLKTKLYCVTPGTRNEAAAIGNSFRDRACLSANLWRLRGVVFPRPLLEGIDLAQK